MDTLRPNPNTMLLDTQQLQRSFRLAVACCHTEERTPALQLNILVGAGPFVLADTC